MSAFSCLAILMSDFFVLLSPERARPYIYTILPNNSKPHVLYSKPHIVSVPHALDLKPLIVCMYNFVAELSQRAHAARTQKGAGGYRECLRKRARYAVILTKRHTV